MSVLFPSLSLLSLFARSVSLAYLLVLIFIENNILIYLFILIIYFSLLLIAVGLAAVSVPVHDDPVQSCSVKRMLVSKVVDI